MHQLQRTSMLAGMGEVGCSRQVHGRGGLLVVGGGDINPRRPRLVVSGKNIHRAIALLDDWVSLSVKFGDCDPERLCMLNDMHQRRALQFDEFSAWHVHRVLTNPKRVGWEDHPERSFSTLILPEFKTSGSFSRFVFGLAPYLEEVWVW